MEEDNFKEELISELAFIGEGLNNISKYLRKIAKWTEADEEEYGEEEIDEDEEEIDEEI